MTSTTSTTSQDRSRPAASHEVLARKDYLVIDLLYYVQVLWRRKFILLAWFVIMTALLIADSYRQPKLFESIVKFTPPARTSSNFIFSLSRNSGDEYRSELTSETVANDVIEHQHLVQAFKVKDEEAARKILNGMAAFAVDVNNFITITVRSTNPQQAADIANEYFNALYRLSERISAKEAEHRLNFVAGPLELEKNRLAESEEALRQAQQRTGLVLPEIQGPLGVQQVAGLHQRIAELQAQLATARLSGTDLNPQVQTLQSQINSLQGQANALERGNGQPNSPANLPQLGLEVQRRERDVRLHQATLDALTRSAELSRLTDTYTPALSLIDPATPGTHKVSPSRSKYALAGAALGILFGLLHVLLTAFLRRWKSGPRAAAQMTAWRSALRGEVSQS